MRITLLTLLYIFRDPLKIFRKTFSLNFTSTKLNDSSPPSLSLSDLSQSPTFGPASPPGTPGKKTHYVVPSESQLTLPLRRYISETLICHVLGQPSHSLACLLVSVITEYLDASLPMKQVSIEDVCRLVGVWETKRHFDL